jgi:hypothetical protein
MVVAVASAAAAAVAAAAMVVGLLTEVGLTAAEDMATPVVPVLVHPPGGKRSTAIARDTALPSLLNTVFPFYFDICTLEGRPGVVKHEQAPTRHGACFVDHGDAKVDFRDNCFYRAQHDTLIDSVGFFRSISRYPSACRTSSWEQRKTDDVCDE